MSAIGERMKGPFIAVDWGTTNRRCYLIENDRVIRRERDDHGVLSLSVDDYAQEVRTIRARFGDLPILCAGMVGSNRGWHEIHYVEAPADLPAIASHASWVAPGVAILPGVSLLTTGRVDVMRGEEVQFLGAVAAHLVPPTALLCQPGTHCKWAWISAGILRDFTTAMTGELFALLKNHSLLSSYLGDPIDDGAAFHEGIADASRHDLLASLFSVRAASLLGRRPEQDMASYVSGLLIGSDVSVRVSPGIEIYLLADAQLGGLYAAAITELGGKAHLIDSHAAFTAGIMALWRRLDEPA